MYLGVDERLDLALAPGLCSLDRLLGGLLTLVHIQVVVLAVGERGCTETGGVGRVSRSVEVIAYTCLMFKGGWL